jgi:alanine racemase
MEEVPGRTEADPYLRESSVLPWDAMIELQMSTGVRGLAMAQAVIDLSRLKQNISTVRGRLAGRAGLLFTVKADAYGHGAGPVARCAQSAGVDALGVANLQEALQLRQAEIELPILILGLACSHHIPILAQFGEDIAVTIDSLDFARQLDREARRLGTSSKVQVKVDTGLGRIGIMPEEVLSFFRSLRQFRHLQVEGIFSHLSVASSRDPADRGYTLTQIEKFDHTLRELDRAGLLPPLCHIANSAGLIGYSEEVTSGFFNLVRPGILLYGYPELEAGWTEEIRPIMSVHTWIVATKAFPQGACLGYGRSYRVSGPLRAAIIPVGYEDGLDIRLSHRGQVAIHGQRAPILGRISMDQTTVDISNFNSVTVGDEVELIGDEIPATALARWSEVPCVEAVLTHIGNRIERVYLHR